MSKLIEMNTQEMRVFWSSPVAQWVKNPVLSQQQLQVTAAVWVRSLAQGTYICHEHNQKKKKLKRLHFIVCKLYFYTVDLK